MGGSLETFAFSVRPMGEIDKFLNRRKEFWADVRRDPQIPDYTLLCRVCLFRETPPRRVKRSSGLRMVSGACVVVSIHQRDGLPFVPLCRRNLRRRALEHNRETSLSYHLTRNHDGYIRDSGSLYVSHHGTECMHEVTIVWKEGIPCLFILEEGRQRLNVSASNETEESRQDPSG